MFFVSFSVADMNWTGEHCTFIVEMFIKTNESVTATQQAFRLHFNLGTHDPVPARNTILLWVTNFRASGSALKQKSTGRPCTSRTPENVVAVRALVQQSPWRLAFKCTQALRLSEKSLQHSYKMMLAQELSERDTETRRELCLETQHKSPMQQLCCSVTRHIFTCVAQ